MQSLRSSIIRLKQKIDGDSKYFYPRFELLKLLSRETIRSVLEKCETIPPERLDSIADQVLSRARRTFAILVVLANGHEGEILHFIEHDNFQDSPIDHRLPFDKAELVRLVPKCSDDFYDKQWEFSAPVFLKNTEHRFLDEFAILPFIANEKIADGGFGEIFRITLHEGHQDPSWLGTSSSIELVRKQFKEQVQGSEQSHRQEYHNFTLLGHLKHPQIQQLFSSYTSQKRHNFIFPRAAGGDMESLFRAHQRPPELQEDKDYYLALARLCSAVEAMHNFTVSKRLDIQVMGLHRDIKPSNVLVSRGDFVLTDFGLSTFKSVTESSTSPFRVGGGDCLPPECEDLQTFCKGVVGRSGDIWALGCVMMELLVYMRQGPAGIINFRDIRVVGTRWKLRTFHGPGKEVNPHVLSLMDELHGSGTPRADQLIDLIRFMLTIEPKSRPEASYVTMRARSIAIDELMYFLEKSYSVMLHNTKSIQGTVEYWKLKSWEFVLTTYVKSDARSLSAETSLLARFEEIITILAESRVEVDRICAVHENTGRALFHDLRQINDTLIDMLPEEARDRAWTYFNMNCIGEEAISSPEVSELADSNDSSVLHRLATLAYAKKFSKEISKEYKIMSSEITDASSAKLRVGTEAVEVEKSPAFQDHNLGWVTIAESATRKRVLIEWIKYDLHWEGGVQKEMIARVLKIATSLNEIASQADTLRILRCIHYYHYERKKAFGLIYSLPDTVGPNIPRTLHSLIKESTKTGTYVHVSLEDRLHLAHTLASTLIDFHKATLVHKSISSHNIIFTSAQAIDIQEPYLIGFNYARPVEPDLFTTGPPPSSEAQKYYHPDYDVRNVRDARPFRMVYDYYSLGLVLLEIGLWDTIDKVKAKSSRDLREKIVGSRVPLLKHCMGTAYQDAVLACLRDKITQDSPEAYMDTVLDFQRLVVEALRNPPLKQRPGKEKER